MEVRGLGQLLAALAAALFVRAIAGPGPALLPPAEDTEDDETDAAAGGGGGVRPVTIRWASITCALKNKRGEVVSLGPAAVAPPRPPSRRSPRETLALASIVFPPRLVSSLAIVPRVRSHVYADDWLQWGR